MKTLRLFAGAANPELALKVAHEVGVPLGDGTPRRFADGECMVEIRENVRGADVFVIQPTSPPANENYMELFMMLDALRRASADRVTAVMP